jgi:hypothetical protein
MNDKINRPTFLTHFPFEIKSFYMQRAEDDKRVTKSVDVLVSGVGEVAGGSMRTWDCDELMAAYKREDIDPSGYFGTLISVSTVPHPRRVRTWWRKVRTPFLFRPERINTNLQRPLAWLTNPLDCARSALLPTLHRQVHNLAGNKIRETYSVMMLRHGEPESPGYSAKFLPGICDKTAGSTGTTRHCETFQLRPCGGVYSGSDEGDGRIGVGWMIRSRSSVTLIQLTSVRSPSSPSRSS